MYLLGLNAFEHEDARVCRTLVKKEPTSRRDGSSFGAVVPVLLERGLLDLLDIEHTLCRLDQLEHFLVFSVQGGSVVTSRQV